MPPPDRPLRILHLTAHSEPGGLSRYILDLSTALARAGHDVRVAGARGAAHALFENAPFEWIDLPLDGGPVALWRAARALARRLGPRVPDVIHSHYRRTTLVARRLQRALARAGPRVPVLYTVHLSDMPLKWPARLWADFGDHAHAPSAEARRWTIHAAGMPPDRVTLIPHGVDTARWPLPDDPARRAARARFGLSPADRVACYVGRLDTPKNETWLLDVLDPSPPNAQLPTPNAQLKLIVAGSGPHEPAFRQAVAARGLSDRVILTGDLPDPLPVYHAADAFLLPSAREGFSYACAEAMCTGLPALRTRTAGTAELIVEGLTGWSTPIDHDAFVSAARDFLARPDLRASGQSAAQHIRQHFPFARQLDATLNLYRRLAPTTP